MPVKGNDTCDEADERKGRVDLVRNGSHRRVLVEAEGVVGEELRRTGSVKATRLSVEHGESEISTYRIGALLREEGRKPEQRHERGHPFVLPNG